MDQLGALPGIVTAEHHGDAVMLTCTDSDTALRGLLAAYPDAHDIEVLGAKPRDCVPRAHRRPCRNSITQEALQ